ncbi:MAG TPA: diaminopimelate decarboxylase [Acidimicrobiia bacterium]|nr:diaminopimelate decarboxylase [Acidimicrobiia bacterium]
MSAPVDADLIPPALRDAELLEQLSAEQGTPLFVYDEDDLRRRCREFASAFGADGVAYAGKAFLCIAMARLVAEEGLHLDVATGGELSVALRAGFPAGRIVFHGNNKSTDELAQALDAGVGRIVADSFDELDRLERLAGDRAAPPSVLVRVTPGVEAHTHEFIETGTLDSKFGFVVHDGVALAAARRVVESKVLQFGGLHSHIGSMIERLDAYTRALAIVVDLCAAIEESTGTRVEELNMGGGLAARYLATDPVMSLGEYEATLRSTLKDRVADAGLEEVPRLMVEPGRSISASAAVTLYRVGTVKTIPQGRTYVAVDGGMSDNPRPVLYGAGYEAYLPARVGEPRALVCSIAGKHCEQGDVVVADARLPEGVQVGDLLAVPVTGAYGYSMASNYNKVPRPAVVFVRDGRARVVIRRETPDDLVHLDAD